MDENKIKEELSRCFIKSLWYHQNCNFSNPENDFGVDLKIEKMWQRIIEGNSRYYQTWLAIDIQLKSTTEIWINTIWENISYPLSIKNYNDMVQRNIDRAPNPLILILFILPIERENWLTLSSDQLQISKCAYWYKCESTEYSSNISTETIIIPQINKFNINTFSTLFNTICTR